MCDGADAATEKKRAKTQAENGEVKASPTNGGGSGNNALNLPIANAKAKAAIVKVTGAQIPISILSFSKF